MLEQRAASESGWIWGSGPTDVVAVLAFEGFSGNTGLTLFDVRNPRSVASGSPSPFPYAGFVTNVVPGQGFGSDYVLH
jgi:hypothetical protein